MIRNLTKHTLLSRKTRHMTGFWERGRGMIGQTFSGFDAMVFPDCSSIHTMFMKQDLDVLFVDRANMVVRAIRSLKPWRPCIYSPAARTVVELPAGVIAATGTEPGDHLDLLAETEEETVKIKNIPKHASCTMNIEKET